MHSSSSITRTVFMGASWPAGEARAMAFSLPLNIPNFCHDSATWGRSCTTARRMTSKLRLGRIVQEMTTETTLRALRIMVTVLREEGHDVRGFYQAGDALRAIREFDPDAVLLDINMPDLNGFTAAQEIRDRYGVRKPLLIAITGVFTRGPDRILTQLAGFDHHLVKPYEMSDVLKLLAPLRSRICQQ
jgi:CheY-like chemotaxis protein